LPMTRHRCNLKV